MAPEDFTYQTANDPAGLAATISFYADRPYLRDQVQEDFRGIGLRRLGGGEVDMLLDGDAEALGDVIMLDCPHVDAQRMAALARLDMRVARSSTHLIVTTSMAALDAVFAAFDQSNPQILVDASNADRILAVGRVIGEVVGSRVRELSKEDRLLLLRLSQQVDAIAQRLGEYDPGDGLEAVGNQLGDTHQFFNGFSKSEDNSSRTSSSRPKLPDPRLVRQIIRRRQARAKFFDPALFADPAWDMLLDLTVAHAEQSQVAVTSLCIASGVPATTALRWVKQMVEAGLFDRIEDSEDKRRAFISLSDKAANAMARYFAEIETASISVAA